MPEALQVNVEFRSPLAENLLQDFQKRFRQLVCLPIPEPVGPSDIRITGSGARVAVVGVLAEFELTFTTVQDVTEVLDFILDSDVKCTLMSKSDGDPVMIECSKKVDDRYTVCYTVKQPGVYLANIQVGSQRASIYQLTITAINTCFRVDG